MYQSISLYTHTLHCITCHLDDAFIQSDLQLIRLSRRQCGVKGLAQGPNSCGHFIVATPGIEPCGSQSCTFTTTLQAALQYCTDTVLVVSVISDVEY